MSELEEDLKAGRGRSPALGDDWFPSTWGPNDEIGAGNLLGPEKTLAAVKLIKTGRMVKLGFPYSKGMPLSPGRSFELRMPGGPTGGPEGRRSRTVWNDDFIATEIGQIGTHMDALGHAGCACGFGKTLFYNGTDLNECWTPYGLKKLGVEKAPTFFTRGVLLDVQGLKGGPLAPGEEITPDDLMACVAAQGLRNPWLSPGDVVLIRTGHGSRFFSDASTWYDGRRGLDSLRRVFCLNCSHPWSARTISQLTLSRLSILKSRCRAIST